MKSKVLVLLILSLSSETLAADIFSEFSWLNDSYGFKKEYNTSVTPISGKKAGCYPVGNGFVFGSLGVYDPINTIDFICGPVYNEPFFGSEVLEVLIKGEKVKFHKQSIRWVKNTDIIVSSLSNDKISVDTIDFAPPLVSSLVRIFVVRNLSNEDITNIKLTFKYTGMKSKSIEILDSKEDLSLKQNNDKTKFYRIGFLDSTHKVNGTHSREIALVFELKNNESMTNIRYIAVDFNQEDLLNTVNVIKQEKTSLLVKTKEWWNNWLNSTVTVDSSDPKLNYILQVQKIILKSQQSPNGGFSPMNGYSYTWARDNNGPVLYCLRIGRYKEARDVLDYFYKVAVKGGFVPVSVKVNMDTDLKDIDLSAFNWNYVGISNAEVPSWIIKQHWWYYTYTGDIDLLKERFKYLKRCLDDQKITKHGRLNFQTDETYMWTLQKRTFDLLKYPNYYLGLDAYSVDSAFEWVACAENLAAVAKLTGNLKEYEELTQRANFIRESINKNYWLEKEGYFAPAISIFNQLYYVPHANIGLNPFWVGYSNENDEKAKSSLFTHLTYLLNNNFLMKTTPNVEHFTGMVPGMLLYNLVFLKSPSAEDAYEALVKLASPSGDYFELYNGKGECWVVPKWGDGCSGRVRPWEGGINADALMFYLSGFLPDGTDVIKLSPSLPKTLNCFSLKGVRYKDLLFDIFVKEEKGENKLRFYEIVNPNKQILKLILDINIPGFEISSLLIDDKPVTTADLKIEKEIAPLGSLKVKVIYRGEEPKKEIERKKFKPQPYYFPRSDIVLLTVKDRFMYYALAKEYKVLPIDMQIPLTPRDIDNAIYDSRNKTIKTKILLFAPEVFSIGPVHWKNYDFWHNSELIELIKKFLHNGGSIIVMSGSSSKGGYEIKPKWLTKLLNGGTWSISNKMGKVVPSSDWTATSLKKIKIDSINIGNEADEKKHNVITNRKTNGKAFASINVMKEWKDSYQFEINSEKGFQHNICVNVSLNFNWKNLKLEVKKEKEFVKLPLSGRTKNGSSLDLSFYLSPQYITGKRTTIRISSEKPDKQITAESIDVYKLKVTGSNPLAELMGFKSNQLVGTCYNALSYQRMVAPLRIVDSQNYAALVMKKTGHGIFLRTQLNFSYVKVMISSLLNNETKTKITNYLKSNNGE